ncbi:MAG: hypothetical protein IJQ02_07525 [Oscillospiraceae bacterium]|nr:hypothetical protein [Oscillospiraceae bacterium]
MSSNFVSFSPENVAIMRRCRELLDQYNATVYDAGEERAAILHEMIGSCGEDVTIQTPFKVTYGKHLYIGSHVFINYGAVFWMAGISQSGTES